MWADYNSNFLQGTREGKIRIKKKNCKYSLIWCDWKVSGLEKK